MHRRPLLALSALPWLLPAAASTLDPPQGPVVLSLSGRVRNTNQGAIAAFDMAMLEALPQASYVTQVPWYNGPRKFSGPLLRDVLAAAGHHGSTMRTLALNDYRVDIPVDDALRYDMLLAHRLDDRPMAVRDKGPLMIVYPFEQHPELRNALYHSRCVWQLKAIDLS